MQDIRLVITSGGIDYEADITNGFDLNLNYTFDNLTNTTELKNTYSKTIKLEGTPKNDMIFERYMDPHHRVMNITGHLRIPFKLFYGSTLYESGYLKLNKINWNNVEHSYEINLFGELGKLIYELDEKTLASLNMPYNNLSHILNRDFIKANWSNESERYHFTSECLDDILSYVPMNNGLYDDFSSNKVQTDKSKNGIELDGNYSEWEMAEFRSYKQRAGVKLAEIISEMLKEATDSYTIDGKFANADNPYWSRLYMTMPKFDEDDLGDSTATKFNMVNSDSNANCTGEFTATWMTVYEDTDYYFDPEHPVLVINGTDAQRRYTVTSTEGGQMGSTILNSDNTFNFTRLEDGASIAFKADGARFEGWTSFREDVYAVDFNGVMKFDVRMRDLNTDRYLKLGDFEVGNTLASNRFHSGLCQVDWNEGNGKFVMPVYQQGVEYTITKDELLSIGGSKCVLEIVPVQGGTLMAVPLQRENPGVAEYYNTYRFNQPQINWKVYDTTSAEGGYSMNWTNLVDKESTCSQLLLSYIKMFGLLLEVDKYDGTVNIWTREGYFDGYKILDWSDKLDRSKEATLNPITFSNKYTLFDYADTKNGYLDTYKDKYGINYGCKKRDTSYEFNNSTEELIKNMFYQNSITTSNSINAIIVDEENKSYKNGWAKGRTKVTLPCSFEWSNNEMEAVDSQYQLLFKGVTSRNNNMRITDDTKTMKENDEIMWNATSDNTVGASEYPLFSDYFLESWGTDMGSTIKSFSTHFAKPRRSWNEEIDNDMPDSAYIFDKFHKNYFNDLYDKDTKVLTAYFYLTPADMLSFSFRNFVMVDGVLYHPNKIVDYNILSHSVTKVELVQVQDLKNYVENAGGYVDDYYLTSVGKGFSTGTSEATYDPQISTNGTIEIVNPVSWIHLNSDLTFTIDEFDGEQRTTYLVLRLEEDHSKTISIYFAQTSERDHTFRINPESMSVNMDSGSYRIKYIVDGTEMTTVPLDYKITVESDSAWLYMGHIATGYVAYQENTSGYQREGTLTFCCEFPDGERAYATHRVVQGLENYYLDITPSSIVADSNGGMFYFTVATNSASPIVYKGQSDYSISVDVANMVSGELLVVVSSNGSNDDKHTVLTFGIRETDAVTDTIAITQTGAGTYYLNVIETKSGEFVYNADMSPYSNKTQKIFESNGTMYQYYASADWISLDENGRLHIDDNLTEDEREATITVGVREDASLSKTVTIRQYAGGTNYYIRVNPTVVSGFPASGGTVTFSYDTNSESDIHIKVSNGTMMSIVDNEDGTATLTVNANTSTNGRTGSVTFWIDELSDEVVVYVSQVASGSEYLSVVPSTLEVGADSGCYDFDVYASGDWFVDRRGIPSWITVTKTSDGITVCTTDNDGETRTYAIRLLLGTSMAYSTLVTRVTITQNSGYYLVDNQYEYTHNQDAGYVQTEIRTNGTPVVESIEILDS